MTKLITLWLQKTFQPDRTLLTQMKKDPCYPFLMVKPRLYALEHWNSNLWKGILLLIVSIIGGGIYFSSEIMDFHLCTAFFVVGPLFGSWMVLTSASKRRLIVDHIHGNYKFYIRQGLVHKGFLHNIYIRLVAQRTGQGKMYYKLILNGYKMEEFEICGLTDKHEALEVMGNKMAERLHLNYFDYKDQSTKHLIRHWPPIYSFEKKGNLAA
ncbi:cation channel sperm-associated auxiliary subunit TMEM249 [Latimeria chalumnae]|uniref:Transmembrane protein 249 n=1 Tax=Latimeria chalumnae TaxID=7897 RepID=M3XKG9_LATCH|nr:PREDICTED: transmembrane protein 249 isoform X1 [Latimeria chalumnae]|eukprot:XP_014353230.1 PREDICTED: transmembrane protein 249 isoform X1 [Latimeria chalumnae]